MGNTTSERVSGERHSAKAARAEGAGGHAASKEHKIMVGSSDDPSVFSLPDARVRPLHRDRAAALRLCPGAKDGVLSLNRLKGGFRSGGVRALYQCRLKIGPRGVVLAFPGL
jgi:hypothetical protein